jgi:hypothetical protein
MALSMNALPINLLFKGASEKGGILKIENIEAAIEFVLNWTKTEAQAWSALSHWHWQFQNQFVYWTNI